MQTGNPGHFKIISAQFISTVLFVTALIIGSTSCQGSSNVTNVNTSSGCVQGSGVLKSEERDLPVFHALDIDGAFSVKIICQKNQTLTLSADDNLLPLLSTEVTGGVLRITTRKSICTSLPMSVNITVASMDQITSGGANDFDVKDIASSTLDLSISGSGNMSISGKTEKLGINLQGASEIHASDLKAKDVTVNIGGAGSAEIYASSRINASISGVGEVRYAGQPKEVIRNITGWGEVLPIDQ